MKTTEQRIRRLELWNRFLLISLVGVGLIYAGNVALNRLNSNLRSLSLSWESDGGVRFHSVSDGPLIVTHLVKYGDAESDKKLATLPQPLAIFDSAGARMTAREIKALVWRDIYGRPAQAPKVGAELKALYLRPAVAPLRQTD